ncbi:hypothetical protein CEXT_17841 [Caerostris extrusa]|uniref:Uncharacterized protein n=1 Tax=Caerostris extrusa TaxID=172846 RepID=A0AAV4Y3U3_CAEEX|nr:hypothetical protein CEXT_17841 [Caerostris extrusa]
MSRRISNKFGKVARIVRSSLGEYSHSHREYSQDVQSLLVVFEMNVEETGAVVSILVELPLTACANDRARLIKVDLNDLERLIVVERNCPFLICVFGNAGHPLNK